MYSDKLKIINDSHEKELQKFKNYGHFLAMYFSETYMTGRSFDYYTESDTFWREHRCDLVAALLAFDEHDKAIEVAAHSSWIPNMSDIYTFKCFFELAKYNCWDGDGINVATDIKSMNQPYTLDNLSIYMEEESNYERIDRSDEDNDDTIMPLKEFCDIINDIVDKLEKKHPGFFHTD
jgi:hypothetical protein